MKICIRNAKLFFGVCAAVVLLHCGAEQASAQAQNQKFVLGDVLVFCQPGTLPADVQALATQIGATQVIPNNMADVYDLRLAAANADAASTTAAIAALKGNPHLRWVGKNLLYKYHI